MRKNGVNRKLTPIDGGVCAPEGFSANGIYCELPSLLFLPSSAEKRENFAAVRSDKRCPTACVYARGPLVGAPVLVSKKHLRTGYGRAVVVTSGVANVGFAEGVKQAEALSRAFAKSAGVLTEETVVASTGKIGEKFPLDAFLSKMQALADGLGKSEEKSLAAARAIMTTDITPKQFAYAFDIGAYRCKIGGICKGSARVSPNMATTICVLTTDANVSPEMLQKALTVATRDTFNLLDIDGASSPNDTVCIMANGRAGNFRIDYEDSEYEKFLYALEQTLEKVCKLMVSEEGEKGFSCKVTGMKSKSGARTVARAVVSSLAVKKQFFTPTQFLTEDILCAMQQSGEEFPIAKTEISLQSESGEIMLFEAGQAYAFLTENVARVLAGANAEIRIRVGNGNYYATAFGRACRG